MACVKKGLSRQDAHEEIRKLSNFRNEVLLIYLLPNLV